MFLALPLISSASVEALVSSSSSDISSSLFVGFAVAFFVCRAFEEPVFRFLPRCLSASPKASRFFLYMSDPTRTHWKFGFESLFLSP